MTWILSALVSIISRHPLGSRRLKIRDAHSFSYMLDKAHYRERERERVRERERAGESPKNPPLLSCLFVVLASNKMAAEPHKETNKRQGGWREGTFFSLVDDESGIRLIQEKSNIRIVDIPMRNCSMM